MTAQERDEALIEIRELLQTLVAALRGVPGSSWPAYDEQQHISASRGRRWS